MTEADVKYYHVDRGEVPATFNNLCLGVRHMAVVIESVLLSDGNAFQMPMQVPGTRRELVSFQFRES
jgi:hypothetical protein